MTTAPERPPLPEGRISPEALTLTRRAHFYVHGAELSDRFVRHLLEQTDRRFSDEVERVTGAVRSYEDRRGHVVAGFTVFRHPAEPSFLKGARLIELRFGIVIIVATRTVLAVSTAGGLAWSDAVLAEIASRVQSDSVARLAVASDARFERLSSRNMSIAPNVIRARAFEAVDLAATLPPLALNRQIVRSLRVRTGGRTLVISPSTGLVAEAGDRVDLERFASWVTDIASVLRGAGAGPAFLRYFAQPMRMEDLPATVQPTGLLLDLAWLRDGLGTEFDVTIAGASGRTRTLPAAQVASWVAALMDVADVDFDPAARTGQVAFPGLPGNFKFSLRQNKLSFSLVEPRLARARVRTLATGQERSLVEAIRDERSLFVTTNDLRYAYAYGQLFRDDRVAAQARSLSGLIDGSAALQTCTTEKGAAAKRRRSAFGTKSLFGMIEKHLAVGDDMLVCDDLGDEWADYIGIRTDPPRITLYHAKHGALGASASAFHEVLGQATKNISRLAVVSDDLASKKKTWARKWKHSGSSIPRLRRGSSAASFCSAYVTAAASPAVLRRVCVVASFASARALRRILKRAAQEEPLLGHESQIVWFLSSFATVCREAGAHATIVCQP